MIALVVYSCLAGQPASCTQEVAHWAEEASVQSCAELGDAQMPLWTRGHPGRVVQSYWCVSRRGASGGTAEMADATTDLGACDVRSRTAVSIWARQNPGKSYWAECQRQQSE